MYKKDQPLLHPIDFDNAMLLAIPVSVWQQGKILDYGGLIEKNKKESVQINGGLYPKMFCEFRVR